MKSQRELTLLLRKAKGCIGMARIKSLLPKPFGIWISDHDTGCQINIDLCEEDRPQLTAWKGSVWYNSCYEFNDRNKVLGLNPETEFCGPKLEEFFTMIDDAVADYEANQMADNEAAKQRAEEKKRETIEYYKTKF